MRGVYKTTFKQRVAIKMMTYPEFFGGQDENVLLFFKNMEVACISNHIKDPTQVLRLMQICLKGDARIWLKIYDNGLKAENPLEKMIVEGLKGALVNMFKQAEDPDKVWHTVQGLIQGDMESIDVCVKKFSLLWEELCKALQPKQPPPDMMKKD